MRKYRLIDWLIDWMKKKNNHEKQIKQNEMKNVRHWHKYPKSKFGFSGLMFTLNHDWRMKICNENTHLYKILIQTSYGEREEFLPKKNKTLVCCCCCCFSIQQQQNIDVMNENGHQMKKHFKKIFIENLFFIISISCTLSKWPDIEWWWWWRGKKEKKSSFQFNPEIKKERYSSYWKRKKKLAQKLELQTKKKIVI